MTLENGAAVPRTPGGRIAARVSKIRAMSAHEIGTRLQYTAFCAVERRAHRGGALAPGDRLHRALVPALRASASWEDALLESRRGRAADFFAGAADRAMMRRLFETRYAAERQRAIADAERVMSGQVNFFGQTIAIDASAWNRDPVGGAEWPRVYHRDVPIHGGNRGWGDVKYVWELNRHQFLVDLARATFLTGDRRYARRARQIVLDWIADNPYATGVNWACALEPAFRTFSWLWTYYLCLEETQEAPEEHLAWLTSIYDHGRFLYRHLEHYSSPYNHLVGEAAALYMLGVLFPEFREAGRWRRRGRQVLETRLDGQFYADGGTVEQSTFYHHATLGFYVLAAVLGRRHGEELAPAVWTAMERAMAFAGALQEPDGRTPAFGGADDGKPLRMEHLPLWDFRPFQAIGAVLFGRAAFTYLAGRFPEDALWLLGPDGFAAFEGLAAAAPASTSVALEHSGYYVLRSGWSNRDDYVCVDCGPQAGDVRTDGVPNSVHGHADCLSIVVTLGGRRVLADSGLLCYNGDPAWEAHFRQTAAHNTIRIDGADQALHLGKMAWSYSYAAKTERWCPANGHGAFVGSHDGYTRRGGDAVHRRLVWLRPEGYLVVCDEILCAREHDAEVIFQFAPGTLDLIADGAARFADIALVSWTDAQVWRARVAEGGARPEDGWIAPSLGVLTPAPRLTLSARIAPPFARVLTILARPPVADLRPEEEDPGVLCVTGPDFDDRVAATAAGVAITRLSHGAPSIVAHVGAGRCA